jgi:hypothetical protein
MNTKIKSSFTLLQILFICAVLAIIAALAIPQARAETGWVNAGVTNASIAALSTNSALGTSPMKIENQDLVQLYAIFGSTTTNAANCVLNYHRVSSRGDVETSPFFTWTIAQVASTPGTSVTNRNVATTNLPASLIGGTYSLLLTNWGNTSALGLIINPTNYVDKKVVKKE